MNKIWFFVLCLLLSFTASTVSAARVALVIGNADYTHGTSLANPANDANDISAALGRLGFDVTPVINANKVELEQAASSFIVKARGADVSLVFYAGHGMQIDGKNLILPVDARLRSRDDIAFETIEVNDILQPLQRNSKTTLMFLDACRDNPFLEQMNSHSGTRSARLPTGLATIQTGSGTLVAFATAPGEVAVDGETSNSPFSAALLDHIEKPGLEIRQLLTQVRIDVRRATNDFQTPWENSSLLGNIYLAGLGPIDDVAAGGSGAPAPLTHDELAEVSWGIIEQLPRGPAQRAALNAFMEEYAESSRVSAARIMLAAYAAEDEAAANSDQLAARSTPPLPTAPPPEDEIEGPEPATSSPAEVMTSPPQLERALNLTRKQRQLIQHGLNSKGHAVGSADGLFGPKTRRGIQSFQAALDLHQTGYLTSATAEALVAVGQQVVLLANVNRRSLQDAATPVSRPHVTGESFVDCQHEPLTASTILTDVLCGPEMMALPSGSFLMGSPSDEVGRFDREGPVRRVTFSQPFAIGVHEITRAQFTTFLQQTGFRDQSQCEGRAAELFLLSKSRNYMDPGFAQGNDHPVVCVGVRAAEAYATWLSRLTGQPYRLPSEAEFEYAARAGSVTMRPWASGADVSQICRYANAAGEEGDVNWHNSTCADPYTHTAPVGQFPANRYGLHDMLGNVSEWTADCWSPNHIQAQQDGSPRVSDLGLFSSCRHRVVRGADWNSAPRYVRSAGRERIDGEESRDFVGFRVVRDLD